MTGRMTARIVAGVLLVCGGGAALAAEHGGAARLPPYPLGPVVVLADGGILAGCLEAITATAVVVESPVMGRLDLPRTSVGGYRASMALGPVAPRRPDSASGEVAVLRLLNGDEVVAAAVTVASGDVMVRLAPPVSRDVRIPLESVRAIDFAASPVELRLPRKFVALTDGSRFVEARVPRAIDPAEVVATHVDGDGGRLLAMLEPLIDEGPPALSAPPARGHTLTGDWPAARGTTAFTGLGIRAPARVRYRFERPVRRLASLVAIDDAAGLEGSVIVRVLARDAAGRTREVHASPILRGGDDPHAIDIDLEGAVGVELVVEPASGGTVFDRTIWLDPRVIGTVSAER